MSALAVTDEKLIVDVFAVDILSSMWLFLLIILFLTFFANQYIDTKQHDTIIQQRYVT